MIGVHGSVDSLEGLALRVAGLERRVSDVFAPWQTYPVALTGAVGSAVGRHKRIGSTVHFSIVFTASAQGAGSFEFSIPFPAADAQFHTFGTGLSRDVSAGGFFFGTAFRGGAAGRVGLTSGNGAISATFPFTFASGDIVNISGTYEAA